MQASPGVGQDQVTSVIALKSGGGGEMGSVSAGPLSVASASGAFLLGRHYPVPCEAGIAVLGAHLLFLL